MSFSLQPTKRYFVVVFLISCLLLEIFTFVIYQQAGRNNSDVDVIIKNYEAIRVARLAMIDASDMAAKEQDYIQTNNSASYQAYVSLAASLPGHLADMSAFALENPEQEENLVQLQKKIEKIEDVINAQLNAIKKGDVSAYSLKNYQTEMEEALSDARTTYRTFSETVADKLESRVDIVKEGRKSHLLTLAVGDIIGLCVLFLANLVIFRLISRKTRAEERLRSSEELFAKVFEGLNDGLYDYNVQEGTVSYSPSYQKMLGYAENELSPWHEDFAKLMHPDDVEQAREITRQYFSREIPTFYNTFRVRHKDGHWIWVMSRGIGVWDDKGNPIRLIGTHTDISTQKQREEELNYFIQENERQQSELGFAKEKAEAANQAKSDFLATISHEIRTPMNAVVGLSGLLLEMEMTPKQHMMVQTLHTNADVLLQLVNDLLDISRIEAGQIELEQRPMTFDSMFKILSALFDNQASAKGVSLLINNAIGKQEFLADSSRIQQILVNLINNALKFTQNGSISLNADSTSQSDGNCMVTISVADTGVGIPSDKLTAIFDKFVQADQTISRRYGGSGLGLSICKLLAELMGGTITVVSEVDHGSVFTLTLPLKTTASKCVNPAVNSFVRSVTNSGRVLVVEDYPANVMVATMMLENLGYEVDVANNGTEALQKVQNETTPYIAILMDVQMHDMDGYTTTKRLRVLEKESGARHFIIGVTAHALSGDREKCIEAGMDDYMSKPIDFNMLAQKLSILTEAA